jgi:hypothetical protein
VATDLREKVDLATRYFLNLLGSAQPRGCDVSLAAVGLLPVDLDGLEAHFSEAEVIAAIHAMPSNKSPGPDGFTWDFYRYCWPSIKTDVMAAMHAVWLGQDQGFEGLNAALLVLLPKKDAAHDLKDFRPISLVHSFARLLTKVMARRLAPRMDDLVDKNQTAFIRGRCIQDNFLLVKESVKLLHRRNIPSLLLKIDVAKAFDSISWSFLLSILRQHGFGPRWLRWITLLLRTANTSVLINGTAGDAFRHGRGLRQGDPISPLLFVIAMEVLSALFRTAEHAGVLADLSSIGLRHRVSLYADDVIIFARPDSTELDAIWGILGCFGLASGLNANLAKSSAAPVRCSDELLAAIGPALSCPIAQLPCTTLVSPCPSANPGRPSCIRCSTSWPPNYRSGRRGC